MKCMNVCNATPRDKREKHKNQETKNGHKGKAMKHKDHESQERSGA